MKRLITLLALTGTMTGTGLATPKADSIKAYTGAARAKFVWDRTVYCRDDYTPVASPTTSMMLFDTDIGVEKSIDNGTHYYLRISRSGKWVTWNDLDNKKSYIMDLTAATPARKLLFDASTSYWCARAWWIDPASKIEYVFCLNNYGPIGAGLIHGDGIYKVALNADGTAGSATKLTINGEPKVDDMLSISQDGKKLGGAFPWPDTKILDIPTGRLDYRHANNDFGCQTNLAADNSYRFFHCQGDHFGIYMFEANMVDKWTYINMSHNLVFFAGRDGMSFEAPRWSNHVQFVSTTTPMNDNWYRVGADNYVGHDATWVKANINIVDCVKFVLQKFTADFKDIGSSIAIAADIRYGERGGDAWFSNGVTGSAPAVAASHAVSSRGPAPIRVSGTGDGVRLTANDGALSRVSVADAQGRVVRAWEARGSTSFDATGLNPGVYCITASSGAFRVDARVPFRR